VRPARGRPAPDTELDDEDESGAEFAPTSDLPQGLPDPLRTL
jgi:hypothetical protein